MLIIIDGALSPSRLENINCSLFQYLEKFKVRKLKNPHFYAADETLVYAAKGEFEQASFLQELKKVYEQNPTTLPLSINSLYINHHTNLPIDLIKNLEQEHHVMQITFHCQDGEEQIQEKLHSKSWSITANTPEVASRIFLYGVLFVIVALLWWWLSGFTL